MADHWGHVSQSPTRPQAATASPLTATDLFGERTPEPLPLDERLRQAYFWIVNNAVISPFYDIGFSGDTALSVPVGDAGAALELGGDQSYSSNVLLPLLSFAVGGRCLLIGGPGRGKTSLAVVLGVLAGTDPQRVRTAVVQGQPQLTVSDLIGTPLPKDLISAERLDEVRVAWRNWLRLPVKIIDALRVASSQSRSTSSW